MKKKIVKKFRLNSRMLRNIKEWLLLQDKVTPALIAEAFKVDKRKAAEIFELLKKKKYLGKAGVKSDVWIAACGKITNENLRGAKLPLLKAVKDFVLKLETAYVGLKPLDVYFAKRNIFQNQINEKKLRQSLDPILAYIQACQKNLKTIIISDKLNCDNLLLFVISELSQITPSQLISGQINDSEWPRLVSACGTVTDWPGDIRTLSSDEKLEATEFLNLCKKSDYEVLILDLNKGNLVATESAFEIARQNNKIIVFANHEKM